LIGKPIQHTRKHPVNSAHPYPDTNSDARY